MTGGATRRAPWFATDPESGGLNTPDKTILEGTNVPHNLDDDYRVNRGCLGQTHYARA
jgi:hypothetical protein